MTLPTEPASERHNIAVGALDCWCEPRYCLPCDECDTGCWKCESGLIRLTRDEAEAEDRPIIIVHSEDE